MDHLNKKWTELEEWAVKTTTKIESADNIVGINDRMKKLEEEMAKAGSKGKEGYKHKDRPILENKAILDIPTLSEDKREYHDWSEEMKNTMDNLRPGMGDLLQWIEGLRDLEEREKEICI